jgi:hypothetical protein
MRNNPLFSAPDVSDYNAIAAALQSIAANLFPNCRSGESFKYQCGSCANAVSWRCSCVQTLVLILNLYFVSSLTGHGVVVPDGVASSQADPLGDRSVLLLRFGKLLLRAERFVGLDMSLSVKPQPGETAQHTGILTFSWMILSLGDPSARNPSTSDGVKVREAWQVNAGVC